MTRPLPSKKHPNPLLFLASRLLCVQYETPLIMPQSPHDS